MCGSEKPEQRCKRVVQEGESPQSRSFHNMILVFCRLLVIIVPYIQHQLIAISSPKPACGFRFSLSRISLQFSDLKQVVVVLLRNFLEALRSISLHRTTPPHVVLSLSLFSIVSTALSPPSLKYTAHSSLRLALRHSDSVSVRFSCLLRQCSFLRFSLCCVSLSHHTLHPLLLSPRLCRLSQRSYRLPPRSRATFAMFTAIFQRCTSRL